MGVLDGQAVSAAVTNPAFLDANADDTGIGKITLANVDPASGSTVDNLQREHNSAASFMGKTLNTSATDSPAWVNNQVGAVGDSLFDRADELTERFDATTGHIHDGTAGNGPQILAANLDAVPLKGYIQQGIAFNTGTGSSVIVTASMSGKTPGGGTSAEGVVTTGAYNKVLIRQATGAEAGDVFTDTLGNEVYGRLTEAAGVWTVSFYVDVSGVQTAYTFTVSALANWFYQEIFNPMGGSAPVFSEFATIPSDNATADVITATTALQGKVSLSASAPGAIASTGSAGTASASVANADHTHEGVHSVSKSGSAQILGDVTFTGSAGVTLTQASQNIDFSAPALSSTTPQPVGSSNSTGTGTTSARADHAHEGVHSVGLSGDPDLYGDVTLAASGGTSATQVGQTITFTSPALTSTAPSDVGSAAAVGTGTASAREDHVHRGIHSVSKSGSSQLFGDVTISQGTNITVTQSSQDIQIATTAANVTSTAPSDVGSAAAVGTATDAARADHVHRGVASVAKSGDAAIYGAVTLSAGTGIALNQVSQNIEIQNTGATPSSNTPQDIGSVASAGTGTSPSRDDHVHKGTRSVSKNGSAQLFGDVTFSEGLNITLTQSGNDIAIASTGGTGGAVIVPGAYPYTLSASDAGDILLIDTTAARTINAYAALSGFSITLKDSKGVASKYPISFVPNGAQKIEGLAATYECRADFGAWTFTFDGTDWFLTG